MVSGRRVSAQGRGLLKQFEEFRAAPYLCPAGWWTIGWGHVIPGPDHPEVDEAEGEALLATDCGKAERAVLRYIAVPLEDWQFDALGSFTFNLGAGALQRSTLRRKINREEHDDIPSELLRWVYGGGRKLRGLITRRGIEGRLYAGLF